MPQGIYDRKKSKPRPKQSKEAKLKIGKANSISLKGKKTPEIVKQKISKSLKGKNTWMKGRKLSDKIKEKIRNSTTGSKNHSWKGGVTQDRDTLRYKTWRKSILLRDNFTCQKTGQSGGLLEVHHINNFADFEEVRFDINNGITLSKEVHKEFHSRYGIKNNTREQLQEFLIS